MAEPEYKRLTRSKLRSRFALAVASRSSLWLGPDHLLVIDSTGYNETYKRFYFRDIQAVTITINRRRLMWNWVLGVLTALTLGGWSMYFLFNPTLDLTLVLVALGTLALFAVPLLLNNTSGPTCTCFLRTAVQTEELCPLKRLRRARQIMDRVRPYILQAQGGPAGTYNPAAAPQAAPSPAPVAPGLGAGPMPGDASSQPGVP